jgi:hypothetical protein
MCRSPDLYFNIGAHNFSVVGRSPDGNRDIHIWSGSEIYIYAGKYVYIGRTSDLDFTNGCTTTFAHWAAFPIAIGICMSFCEAGDTGTRRYESKWGRTPYLDVQRLALEAGGTREKVATGSREGWRQQSGYTYLVGKRNIDILRKYKSRCAEVPIFTSI